MIELTTTQQRLHLISSISLVLLIVLCILWELVLAPLRPGGSWMVIKVLPLFAPLSGTLKKNVYTLQWASMFILLYFTEGVVRAWSDHGLSQILAGLEVVFSTTFFICAIFFLRPYKKAAKNLVSEANRKAANPDVL
jgi:uncharacterized membrane protein